jgi:hypothetical protein
MLEGTTVVCISYDWMMHHGRDVMIPYDWMMNNGIEKMETDG